MLENLLITFAYPIILLVTLIVAVILAKKYTFIKKYIPAIITAIIQTEQVAPKYKGNPAMKKKHSEGKLNTALQIAQKIEPTIKNQSLKKVIKWTEMLVPIVTKFF